MPHPRNLDLLLFLIHLKLKLFDGGTKIFDLTTYEQPAQHTETRDLPQLRVA